MVDPQTARFITRNYPNMQGLVQVPVGLFVIIQSLGMILGWPAFQQGDCTLATITVPLTILFTLLAIRYYRKNFGEVKLGAMMPTIIFSSLIVVCWLVIGILDMTLTKNIPASFTMLGIAGIFVVIAICSEGRRRYYYVFGTLLAISGLLPLFGLYTKLDLFGGSRWMGNIGIGLTLVLGGLLDHWNLVRILKRSKAE
jgi:hypothetical protein